MLDSEIGGHLIACISGHELKQFFEVLFHAFHVVPDS